MVRRAMMAGTLILLLAAVAAAASNVDGSWQGNFSGPNGDMTLTFKFKAQGTTLTGAVESQNGDIPISDGKIDGNKISFKVQVGDNTINHEGTISGDTIDLKTSGAFGDNSITLKRVAANQKAKTDQ